MKIAVCSSDFVRVTGHAGRARRWLVFEGERGGTAVLVDRVDLAPEMVFHHYREPTGHPLDGVGAVLTRSAGDNLMERFRKRGVEAMSTRERDAAKAATDYLNGRLAPPPPPNPMRLLCKLHDYLGRHL